MHVESASFHGFLNDIFHCLTTPFLKTLGQNFQKLTKLLVFVIMSTAENIHLIARAPLFLALKIVLVLANSVDNAVFHMGLHCLPKYPYMGIHYTKGLLSGKISVCFKERRGGGAFLN